MLFQAKACQQLLEALPGPYPVEGRIGPQRDYPDVTLRQRALQPFLRAVAIAHSGVAGRHQKRSALNPAFSGQTSESGLCLRMETAPLVHEYLYSKHHVRVINNAGRTNLGHGARAIAEAHP